MMRKILIFGIIGFCAFILFSRFFLGTEMGDNYQYMSVFDDVFGVFTWISEKIKAVYDGIKNVGDWWSNLFGGSTT